MMNNDDIGSKKLELLKRVGNISQVASIRKYRFAGGKSEGVGAFDVVNGTGLKYTLLEGKCLDIFNLSYKGINFNFISKPDLVSAEYFSPFGNEFHKCFQGGMLYTCGLLNVGSPCNDDGVQHYIHGRIGQTPAENVSMRTYWDGDEYILEASGEMREANLFGENMRLSRKISTKLGLRKIYINDIVENLEFSDKEYTLLYHFNFGYPLLDENAEFIAPVREVKARDEDAAAGLGEYERFGPPYDDFREQVFYHDVAADKDGYTYAALINRKLGLGMYIRYNVRQLPRLIQWKSQKSGDYAMGIEPANCLVEGRVKEKERGTIRKLAAMEAAEFTLELGIIDGADEINSFTDMVKEIGGCV